MNGIEQNNDGYQQLSNAVGPNPAPAIPNLDVANSMVNTPGGVLLPQPSAPPSPALTAPGASSPTNAAPAPAPGSFGAKFGAAAAQLVKAGADPMSALVSAGIHTLSQHGTDTPSPSNTTWDAAQSNADATRPTTPPRPQPSNGQKIVSGIEANLGDVAAATEGGTAGGGIAGAFRVAKASTTRQREEQENNIKMATANAAMLHEQQLLHKTGEDAVQASLAIGKQSADEMLAAPHAETIASGKTSDDIKKMIDSKVVDPSKDAIFLTGRTLTGTDQNGLPQYRSTYSVIKPGDRIHPSQENIDFLNKYLPGQDFKGPEDVEEGKEGQSFDSHTYYMLSQRAMNRFADQQAIAKTSAETEDKVHKALLEKGSQELSGNQYVQAAIRDVAPVRGGDPFLFQKAFNILAREAALDPNIAKQLPKNWQQQFAYTYGGGEPKKFEDQMTQLSKLQEKAQETGNDILTLYGQDPAKFGGDKLSGVQTAADNAIRQAAQIQDPAERAQVIARAQNAKAMAKDQANYEANQKGAEETARETAKKNVEVTGSNGSTETGDAFLQTLPVARRTVVQGYIDGTSTWSPRMAGSKYGQSLLQDIRQAAGGTWDETKGQAYAKNRLGFTSGKESVAIGAANTSMHHLANMWNHLDTATAGLTGQLENALTFGAANKSGQAVADDAKAVSDELGRLYTGGVVGQHEAEEWKEKLDPFAAGMSVNKLRTNVQEFTRLLGGKLQSLQNQWDDGKPSDNLRFDKGIISQDNLDAYNKITGDNLNITDIQKGPSAPAAQQQKATPSQTAGGVIVNTPDGPLSFKTQQLADAFRLKYGLK